MKSTESKNLRHLNLQSTASFYRFEDRLHLLIFHYHQTLLRTFSK